MFDYIEFMSDSGVASPAIRSTLTLACWFLAQAATERSRLSPQKLQQLMYLAQAFFAATQQGRKLIPATFLATADGPLEPTVSDALERDIKVPGKISLAKPLEDMLTALWQQYGRLPATVLMRVIAVDGVWRTSLDLGPDSEISAAAMGKAYAAALSRPAAARAAAIQVAADPATAAKADVTATTETAAAGTAVNPPPLGAASSDIRVTLDGRLVTRWAPRRRIDDVR